MSGLVQNSRLHFARNFILLENKRLRSSQPSQAAERYMLFLKKSAKKDIRYQELVYLSFK